MKSNAQARKVSSVERASVEEASSHFRLLFQTFVCLLYMPPTFLAWNIGALTQSVLSRDLGQRIQGVNSESDVLQMLPNLAVGALFVARSPLFNESEMERRLRWIRNRHRRLIIIWVEQVSEHTYALPFRLVASGLIDMLIDSRRVETQSLADAVAKLEANSITDEVVRCIGALTPEMETGIRRAMRAASQPISTGRLAALNGVEERTFRKQCRRLGMPNPQRLAAWSRLLVAAWWLDHTSLKLSEITIQLGFPSSDALRKLSIRTLGASLTSYSRGAVLASISSALAGELLPQNVETI